LLESRIFQEQREQCKPERQVGDEVGEVARRPIVEVHMDHGKDLKLCLRYEGKSLDGFKENVVMT
jgi:hypothetical protein